MTGKLKGEFFIKIHQDRSFVITIFSKANVDDFPLTQVDYLIESVHFSGDNNNGIEC